MSLHAVTETERCYRPAEAAAVLGIDVRTLYRWIRAKRIRVTLLGDACTRIAASDLQAYIDSCKGNR